MTEKAKHTPGPWHSNHGTAVWGKTGCRGKNAISIIANTMTGSSDGSDEANARLIAASPELLEAARATDRAAEHHPYCKAMKDRVDTGNNCTCFLGKIRAAIAKA